MDIQLTAFQGPEAPLSRRRATRLLAGMAGAACAGLLPLRHALATELPPSSQEPLKAIASSKGMRFGNAMGYTMDASDKRVRFQDPGYRALMARECNAIVAENETKWPYLQPRPGEFNFAPADQMFAWAQEQGMAVRGHTLVWQQPKWLPQWVTEHNFGTQPAREAERLLRQHIGIVCGHFGDAVYSYDVVNEGVDPKTGELRSNVLTQAMGGDAVALIDLAFRLARERAPQAQLVYNDFMHWDGPNHRVGVLKLLQALKARGTPVQALGLQSHIEAADQPASARAQQHREWRKFLDEVSAMGLDLLITEFDVSDRKLPTDIAQRDAAVAASAREYLDITLSYPRLRDFLLWGMADHVSWLQGWKDQVRADGQPQRCTPFDAQLRGKPLRTAIADALRAMPQREPVRA
jgi:endo-1,4-beta-xylanase